jgi:hypothetical protein
MSSMIFILFFLPLNSLMLLVLKYDIIMRNDYFHFLDPSFIEFKRLNKIMHMVRF